MRGAANPTTRTESAAAARARLFAERDEYLAHLRALDGEEAGFVCDRTPESLRALERWYFALVASNGFRRIGTTKTAFERAMAFYFGAVAARTTPARWVVEANPFAGGAFQLGVGRKLHVMMIGGMCHGWSRTPSNARRDALYRRFRDAFGAAPIPPKREATPRRAPAAVIDDAAVEREIERLLARRSTPLLLSGELWTFVRHALRTDRITLGRVTSAVARMVARGVLEPVLAKRGPKVRYRIAAR